MRRGTRGEERGVSESKGGVLQLGGNGCHSRAGGSRSSTDVCPATLFNTNSKSNNKSDSRLRGSDGLIHSLLVPLHSLLVPTHSLLAL